MSQEQQKLGIPSADQDEVPLVAELGGLRMRLTRREQVWRVALVNTGQTPINIVRVFISHPPQLLVSPQKLAVEQIAPGATVDVGDLRVRSDGTHRSYELSLRASYRINSVVQNPQTKITIELPEDRIAEITRSKRSIPIDTMRKLAEVNSLLKRLSLHRETLAHYLDQLAEIGSAYVRPEVASAIRRARAEIARVKTALRALGESVEDQFDDIGERP
jgi:hypothetical protein